MTKAFCDYLITKTSIFDHMQLNSGLRGSFPQVDMRDIQIRYQLQKRILDLIYKTNAYLFINLY